MVHRDRLVSGLARTVLVLSAVKLVVHLFATAFRLGWDWMRQEKCSFRPKVIIFKISTCDEVLVVSLEPMTNWLSALLLMITEFTCGQLLQMVKEKEMSIDRFVCYVAIDKSSAASVTMCRTTCWPLVVKKESSSCGQPMPSKENFIFFPILFIWRQQFLVFWFCSAIQNIQPIICIITINSSILYYTFIHCYYITNYIDLF